MAQDLDAAIKKLMKSGASDEDITFFIQNYKPSTEIPPVQEPVQTPVQTAANIPNDKPSVEEFKVPEAGKEPFFTFPFASKVKEIAEGGRSISPMDMFTPTVEAPGIRKYLEDFNIVPNEALPFKGLEKFASNILLSALEGATSPGGITTAAMGGFPQTRALARRGLEKIFPGMAREAVPEVSSGTGSAIASGIGDIRKPNLPEPNLPNEFKLPQDYVAPTPGSSVGSMPDDAAYNLARQKFNMGQDMPPPKPKVRLNPDGTYTDVNTGEIFDKAGNPVISPDPNFNQGVGDPELAGSIPYEPAEPPVEVPKVNPFSKFKPKPAEPPVPGSVEGSSLVDEITKAEEQGFIVLPKDSPALQSATMSRYPVIGELSDGSIVINPSVEKPLTAPAAIPNPQFNPRGRTGMTGTANEMNEGRRQLATVGNEPPMQTQTGDNLIPPGPPPQGLLPPEALQPHIPIQKRKVETPPEQSPFSQIWNAPRSLQSVDLPGVTSAALRQSRPLAFTREWFKAWSSAYSSFGSKEALDTINKSIKNSKYFKPRYEPVLNKSGNVTKYIEKPSIAEELGVKMTDVINTREEAIASSLAERIPGYGRYVMASNRAYTGFLNDLRHVKFEQMMDGAIASGKDPTIDQVLGKHIADFVNNATGRGSLKYLGGKVNLEPIAGILGNSLYSPRALSARLAFVNPSNYTKMNPLVRKEYWKGLARIGTSWGAFTGLASLMPDVSVSLDANNTDFGKIRIGNTRIDPGAGWQQLMVLAHRELPQSLGGGGVTSSTGPAGSQGHFTEFGSSPVAPTRLSLPARYIYNQLNPSLRFVFDMLSATRKEPFDLTDRSIQMVLPMYAEDIADAAEDDSVVAEFFSPLLSSMGTGIQKYDKGSFNKPKYTPLIEKISGIDLPTAKIGR